jgi:hypothetical protein
LRTLDARSRARHAALMVVVFPVEFQLEDAFTYYHHWGDIMHFNAEAHDAVAEAIFAFQQTLGVARPPASDAERRGGQDQR